MRLGVRVGRPPMGSDHPLSNWRLPGALLHMLSSGVDRSCQRLARYAPCHLPVPGLAVWT